MSDASDVNQWPAVARLFRLFGRGAMLLLGSGAVIALLTADPSAPLTFQGFETAPAIQKVTTLVFSIGLVALLILPLLRNVLIATTARGDRRRRFLYASTLGATMILIAYALALSQLPGFAAPGDSHPEAVNEK